MSSRTQTNELLKTYSENGFRIYEYAELTALILVPLPYDEQLEEVRTRRQALGSSALETDMHPLANRLFPEECVPLIRKLPDPELIQQVILTNEPHPRSKDKVIRSSSKLNGTVYLYERDNDSEVFNDLCFEWSYLLKQRLQVQSYYFNLATKIEYDNPNVTYYNTEWPDDNWSYYMAERLLLGDNDIFSATCARAPLRMSILGKALSEVLTAVSGDSMSSFHKRCCSRVEYIEATVLPAARAMLLNAVHVPESDDNIPLSILLMFYLQAKKQLEALDKQGLLNRLDLSKELIGDDQLACFANLSHIRELNLSNTYFTDDGLKHIAGLASLESLSLNDTATGYWGLTHIRKLPKLKRLDLKNTAVNDSCTVVLQDLTQLVSLDLTGTELPEEELAYLKDKLPNCQITI